MTVVGLVFDFLLGVYDSIPYPNGSSTVSSEGSTASPTGLYIVWKTDIVSGLLTKASSMGGIPFEISLFAHALSNSL